MNRNFRQPRVNTAKRGKPTTQMNARAQNSSATTNAFQPVHSSDLGHQQSDNENPFSHLALEIQMDRPSANPFDCGVMPSFDDRAIDADYRNETARKFGDPLAPRGNRQPPRAAPRPLVTKEVVNPPVALDVVVPTVRPVKDVNTMATPTPVRAPIVVEAAREPTIVKKVIPDVHPELDLDDFYQSNPPVMMPSIDLKPQINIRSRSAVINKPRDDVRPQLNIFNRKPVAEPVVTKPIVVHPASTKPIVHPAPAKPIAYPILTKPILHPAMTRPFANPVSTTPVQHPVPTKPVIDYFGTHSAADAKQEVDQKEEYFRESQVEANKILFGVEEPTRPLTNSEVSKRKKLILKLVDQKLKLKLTELMTRLGERSKAESASSNRADSFADQMENLVPDSLPDNANPEQTQIWTSYPSAAIDAAPTWNNNFQPEVPHNNHDAWPNRPPMFQSNSGWMGHQYPGGVDPMHNARFPGMPPMRPHWSPHPNPWQPHMRPPEQHWHSQNNWNMRPMNPHLMQPNVNNYQPDGKVDPFNQFGADKPATDLELQLKEKEFLKNLERTKMGSKKNSQRRDVIDSNRRKSPEKLSSRNRRFSRDRAMDKSRDNRKRTSEDRVRDRVRHENRSSSNRSSERMHRGVQSPSRLSPLNESPLRNRNRSRSGDNFREFMCDDDQFDQSMDEMMPPGRSRSPRDSDSEDLRVRLSQRRNNYRSSPSPSDLRFKLSDSRQNRDDDLRNQLAERSERRKRSRSRSRSRGKSIKKITKFDPDDSEWMKFNNIVGMLMNIDRNAELSSEELGEKKEIMGLLLENPDLLELDDKFVYKFGKGRLTLAVKEAENILYPNGVPDERIASLISKKIAGLSTEKKSKVTKETVPIEWIKLGNIIDQVLHLTIAERKNLSANDKRMLERDELLLKISEDPDSMSAMGSRYGHRNVDWACKYATKILYHNGVRDKRVDETIAKERKKALERIGKMRNSRNSSESHRSTNSSDSEAKSRFSEWNKLSDLVTKLVQSTLEKFEKMSRDDIRGRDDLLVQMSRDPDAIRSNTKFTDNIDKAILNDVIEKCKQIIGAVKSSSDKAVVAEFERLRSRLITNLNNKSPRTCIHDQIVARVSVIFGKKQEKWTAEEKIERETLTEALIKDPESLKTNTKALERIGDDKLMVDEIIADVKQILSQLDPSKARGPKKFHISSTKALDIPLVVKIVDASGQLNDSTKPVLLKALRDMISEIDNPPKPKLLQQRYIDDAVEVVCANLLTFEWLKRAIVSDFPDKWSGADLKIERVPVATKIPREQLKSVTVTFKDTRATLPFDEIVREIRKENPKLYPERWEIQDARGVNGDYKKKTIGIDIESLAQLEQMNRFARLGRSLVYFDISYMGDDVPNFEATCQ